MTDLFESRAASSVLPVSLLVSSARLILERSLPLNWVSGEVSNYTRAPSGHCYFILKDDKAQVRCVLFRHKAQYVSFALRDGMQVEVRALATLYEARGEFQLTVEAVRQAGMGALYEAFARLKAELEARGWFAPERKRALPFFPRRVGIVTSPQAAALHDVLTTLRRRMLSLPVIVYPCGVQGRSAGDDIASAIRRANARAECDVLIVCRGGGSIEDLWAFNEEGVARAVFESTLPVVSGVGHETDFTICDFVADARAPTPTGAASLVAPDRFELDARVRGAFLRIRSAVLRALEQRMQRVDQLSTRLRHPAARLAEQQHGLRALAARLARAWRRQYEHAAVRLEQPRLRLARALTAPLPQRDRLTLARERLRRAQAAYQQRLGQRLLACERALTHLNPQAVLERGYSIVSNQRRDIVTRAEHVALGESLTLQFAHGGAHVTVTEKKS